MKGIIFNLVEEAITASYGEAVWDSVLATAGVDGAYTTLGNYEFTDLTALIDAGALLLGVTPVALTHTLGKAALLGLARRYPVYFEPFDSTRPFLLTLNEVIHPEVRKLHPDANPPDFWFEQVTADGLVVHYRSERQLCALAVGMISGASTYFGEKALLTETECMLDGADHCVFDAQFVAA